MMVAAVITEKRTGAYLLLPLLEKLRLKWGWGINR
jgi:hypothetical protein